MNAFTSLSFCFVVLATASPPCGTGYGQIPCPVVQYVPAKPGQTPSCAMKDSTFCETIPDYPTHIIKTLLKNVKIKDMLADEVQTEFKKIKRQFPHVPNFFSHESYEHSGQDETPNIHYFKNFYGNSPRNWPGKAPNYQYFGSTSSSYYQPKYGYGDYRRKRRQTDASSKEFIENISPRNKRQVSPNREELCEIRTNFINPQAALNSRGNWMYVVNGDTATQLVKTETCVSDECSNLCQLPNNYSSRCDQKYVQKRLVALDAKGDRLYTDTFWFPSCCVCTLASTRAN